MSLGTSFVKSSLEINPRWSAPEVLREGYYSPAADVYGEQQPAPSAGLIIVNNPVYAAAYTGPQHCTPTCLVVFTFMTQA